MRKIHPSPSGRNGPSLKTISQQRQSRASVKSSFNVSLLFFFVPRQRLTGSRPSSPTRNLRSREILPPPSASHRDKVPTRISNAPFWPLGPFEHSPSPSTRSLRLTLPTSPLSSVANSRNNKDHLPRTAIDICLCAFINRSLSLIYTSGSNPIE